MTDPLKRRMIFNYYKQRADIILMQETHSSKEIEKIWESEFGGKIYFAHGNPNARGVCTAIKKTVKYKVVKEKCDQEGRSVVIELESMDDPRKRLSLANIYAPNADKPNLFLNVIKLASDMSPNLAIVGDFNLVLDPNMDRSGSLHNPPKSHAILSEICEELMLIDVWRVRNPDKKMFSWMRTRPKYTASRIDYGLISQGLAADCINTMYLPGIKSDHTAFYIALDQIQSDRGPGFWKFNNMHLTNKDFCEKMSECIKNTKCLITELNRIDKWIYLKKEIIKTAKQFSKNHAKEKELIISQLSEKILEMEHRIATDVNPKQNDLQILRNSKDEIEELLEEKTKGIMFRTKAKWIDLGETVNSKYFFNLEKARYNARICNKIINDNGEEIIEPTAVLNMQPDFYMDLYTSDPEVNFTLQNTQKIYVPNDVNEQLNKLFTMEELTQAVKQSKRNKTPGISGLTADFYKMFYHLFKEILFGAVEEIDDQRRLPSQMRKTVINLIPKANKDSRRLAHLRPISLLCSDYKLVETMVANRLELALDHIVHNDQKGFRKNKRMSANLRKIFDLITYADKHNLDCIILSLDFMKCFDRIEHNAIIGAMEYFKFPGYMVEWAKILYKEFKAVVQNNGYFTQEFDLNRGIRQGGPASSLFFVICAEILALELRSNTDIQGIPVNDIVNLLGQFADDMDIYMLCEQKSLNETLRTLRIFQYQAGFAVSYEKTQIYRIGSLKNSEAKLYTQSDIRWTNEPIKVLGITVSQCEKDILDLNYKPTLSKVETILKTRGNRQLNLLAKVSVVNTLIGSLFIHKMFVLPNIPSTFLKSYKKLVENFLWNGGKPKITFNLLQNAKSEGGLKLTDLAIHEKSIKVSWIKLLDEDRQLSNIAYSLINQNLKDKIWWCNCRKEDIDQLVARSASPFWYDVILAWSEVRELLVVDKNLLWYNSDIKIDGKLVFWKDCFEKGLLSIRQLYKEGVLISFRQAQLLYGLDLMRFNSIISAIPKYYKTKENLMKRDKWDKPMSETIKLESSSIYNLLIEDKHSVMIKKDRWQVELKSQISKSYFLEQFNSIFKVTNISKFRSFQYRLLHRAIVTNVHLNRWKK